MRRYMLSGEGSEEHGRCEQDRVEGTIYPMSRFYRAVSFSFMERRWRGDGEEMEKEMEKERGDRR